MFTVDVKQQYNNNNLFLLSSLPSESSCLLPCLFCSFCFIPFHLLSSKRSITSLVTHGIFLDHWFPSISFAASVTAVLQVVIMISMPIFSSLRPMSGVNFPHIVAWKVHATSGSLNFSRSNLGLGCFGFFTFFR